MNVLETYLPIDRRYALTQGITLPEHVHGAALYADISGFTPLTEALTRDLGPRRGIEELLQHLNAVYDALIAEVDRYGGSVLSFSGDAITCWFDDKPVHMQHASDPHQSASLRAVGCAFEMQAVLDKFSAIPIPGGTTIALAMKVAVASGAARRFLVGDPIIQIFDVLAGETVTRMVAAERIAPRGQVLADSATVARSSGSTYVTEWIAEPESGERFAMLARRTMSAEPIPWPEPTQPLSDTQVHPWILPPIYERLHAGIGEFLTELRPAVPLFFRFLGIDYEQAEASAQLDTFVRRVQSILTRYDGTLMQLSIGEKGSYIYAAFGAPTAHEDDARRAVRAALDILDCALKSGYLQPLQIGVSQGTLRTGAYGGTTRRTYGAMGDDVNLAARLMQQALPGQVLVSDRVQRAVCNDFQCDTLPPISVKGKLGLQPVFALRGANTARTTRSQEPAYNLPMVGRDAELALVATELALALEGKGQVVGITGEAGMGKSRLVAEVTRLALQHGLRQLGGECQSYGTNIPYLVWGPIWRAFFDLDLEPSPQDKIKALETAIANLTPERAAAAPLLGAILDLPLPENTFTRPLEPQYRKLALEALLLDCLSAAARQAGARRSGLLLVLEDLHWIDPASFDLLQLLVKAVVDLPVLIVLAYRPPDLPHFRATSLEGLPHFTLIELHELASGQAEQLTRAKLAQILPDDLLLRRYASTLLASLIERITERAQGNPFYIEELLNYLHSSGIDPYDPSALDSLDLPTSLQRLILARIDQLSESQKITLKVASVIGRLFPFAWLHGCYPSLGDPEQIKADLAELSRLDLTPLDRPEPEPAYLFKHILTQEVAYESLGRDTRARLHEQLAVYLETLVGEGAERYLDLLAYHYDLSENLPKRREYLHKAGKAAAARFANTEAVDYLSRALALTPETDLSEHFGLLQVRERVYDLQGVRDLQSHDIAGMIALAEALDDDERRAEAAQRKANFALRTSDYAVATEAARQAVSLAEKAGLNQLQARGHRVWGMALMDQGKYSQAQAHFEESLSISRAAADRQGEATTLGRLGYLAYSQSDYAQARADYQQSLDIARSIGDRQQEGLLLSNLGMVARSQGDLQSGRSYYEQSLGIAHAIGDRRLEGGALNSLGIIALSLGDHNAARDYYERSLGIAQSIGDRRQEGSVLNNLGLVALDLGNYADARVYFEQCLMIDRAIGNRRGESITLGNLGDVATALGDYTGARTYYEQNLAISRALGNREDEGWALSALGNVALYLGDHRDARRYYFQALDILRATGDRMWEGNTLWGLGKLALEKGALEEAADYYRQSSLVWRELGMAHFAAETTAGIAQTAALQRDTRRAQAYVEEILDYLESGSLDGVKEPARVYLTCYQVLDAAGDPRAGAILKRAHTELHARAGKIPDEATRRAFLENVPHHRELQNAWETRHAP